jgi:hypothetical protein
MLTWSAVEGGTYRVEAITNSAATNWATLSTNVSATAFGATYNEAAGGNSAQRFYRVGRTALANYYGGTNSSGGAGAVAPGGSASRGNTITVTITLPTTPPLPPANLVPTSVSLAGSISGTMISRPVAGTVLATFTIPANAATGLQNIVVTFNPAPTYTMSGAFMIN